MNGCQEVEGNIVEPVQGLFVNWLDRHQGGGKKAPFWQVVKLYHFRWTVLQNSVATSQFF